MMIVALILLLCIVSIAANLQTAVQMLMNGEIQSQRLSQYGKTRNTMHDLYTQLVQGEWKAYKPDICRSLRENAGISEQLYQENLIHEALECLSSDSKSGQAFWKSKSGTVVVKTIKQYEAKNFRKILKLYQQHVHSSESTIGNVLGIYRIRTGKNIFQRKTYYFLVTKNVYHQALVSTATIQPSLKFDLKGSTIGRIKSLTSGVHKDMDLITRHQKFLLGSETRKILLHALEKDVHFLSDFGFMDYSLLVEVEEDKQSIFTRFFRNFLHPVSKASYDQGKLVLLGSDGRIYHFGMIDFLQKYTFRKWCETLMKGFFYDRRKISCVAPKFYATRMLEFIDRYTE